MEKNNSTIPIAATVPSSSLIPPAAGSATGNPRNKCVLQPGHSLIDWIRLGNSGKDLTGVGGRLKPVSVEELATHNTTSDAWLAIRGRVYNITHYVEYHPGGVVELMRGAGIDATMLFEQIHPWVNYESLLAKCLVGPLRSDFITTPIKSLVRRSVENLTGKITSKKKECKTIASLVKSTELSVPILAMESKSLPSPRLDWIQTTEKCTIYIYVGAIANPALLVNVKEHCLSINVQIDHSLCEIVIKTGAILKSYPVIIVNNEIGKIELIFKKETPSRWNTLGDINIGPWEKWKEYQWLAELDSVVDLTKDVKLLNLVLSDNWIFYGPIASHVNVHLNIEGTVLTRSYTLLSSWCGESGLSLAVKSYCNGAVSSVLVNTALRTQLSFTGPYSPFELNRLKNTTKTLLFAAGSGITPMLSLIHFQLNRRSPKCQSITLMLLNKTEEDIIFKNKLEELVNRDERFKLVYVLSEPSTSWTGYTGRIRYQLLHECIQDEDLHCSENCYHFAFICGPVEFSNNTKLLLIDTGMRETCIYSF